MTSVARVIEQMKQQIEQLRRQLDGVSAAQHAIAGAIDEERAEATADG